MTGNRNLFRITRFVLLKMPLLFKFLAAHRTPQKRLLIIKTDAIGDYILFRNYLEIIARSEKFKGYAIDVLGNSLWRSIALNYDADFVDEFFFISPDALYHAPLQVFKLGWKLFRRNYLFVLQPTYSRTFITDGLAGLAAAKQTIGFKGDTERIAPKYKAKTDRFYTERLLLPQSVYFEFDRTRFFFESVLGGVVEIYGPHIPVKGISKSGIVIFPGSGIVKRSWEKEKFLELIKLIRQQTRQTIYLAGGPYETKIGNYIEAVLPANAVTNVINKTSLPELIELIGGSTLVIANETSAIHIAAATQTPAICILGGGHFGRFSPYPEYMLSKPICVFEKMECYYCNWECRFTTLPAEPHPCINNVSLVAIWQAAQPFIAQL